jgi:hypothetical protein
VDEEEGEFLAAAAAELIDGELPAAAAATLTVLLLKSMRFELIERVSTAVAEAATDSAASLILALELPLRPLLPPPKLACLLSTLLVVVVVVVAVAMLLLCSSWLSISAASWLRDSSLVRFVVDVFVSDDGDGNGKSVVCCCCILFTFGIIVDGTFDDDGGVDTDGGVFVALVVFVLLLLISTRFIVFGLLLLLLLPFNTPPNIHICFIINFYSFDIAYIYRFKEQMLTLMNILVKIDSIFFVL